MILWRASVGGALVLIVGRVFGAAREFLLARQVGPTDDLASYVLASTILLAIGGLVSGVASVLVLRQAGPLKSIRLIILVMGSLPVFGAILYAFWSTVEGGDVFVIFALSVPLYAAYGVANGRLLRSGVSVFGMLTSTFPPFFGFVTLFIPYGSLTDRGAWGNLLGSVIMAFLTIRRSNVVQLEVSNVPAGKVLIQAAALSAVSAINIASPIVDRLFANMFHPEELVLLNLGAILYVGAVTSLGIAMGNAAVSRESINGSGFSVLSLTAIPVAVGAVFLLASPLFASTVLGGANYGSTAPGVLTAVCVVYALATPCAIQNQVYMRLWNRIAPARSMVAVAVLLLTLNVAGNWFFGLYFGVIGIAIATLSVQIVQSIVLGLLRKSALPSAMAVFYTLTVGGVLVAVTS